MLDATHFLSQVRHATKVLEGVTIQQRATRAFDDGDLETAATLLQDVIHLFPDDSNMHSNLGGVCEYLKRYNAAMCNYNRALSLNPENVEAHLNRANLLLRLGDYVAGFAAYEWRWKSPRWPSEDARPALPRWDGDPTSLKGSSIVLETEQGLGDVIQFARYIPVLKSLGASAVFVHMRLYHHSLFGVIDTIPGLDDTLPHGASLKGIDYWAPIVSLPFLLVSSIETIPNTLPYLFPDGQHVDSVRKSLGAKSAVRVGIAWGARTTKINDGHKRSIPITQMERLTEIPGVDLFSLQGTTDKPLPAIQYPLVFRNHNNNIRLRDIAYTAAVVSEMDLVITADTIVAHLAGALGVPVWVLLPHHADWRWLEDRHDSPWYPRVMRLFRQSSPGDWNGVLERVIGCLTEFRGLLIGAGAALAL